MRKLTGFIFTTYLTTCFAASGIAQIPASQILLKSDSASPEVSITKHSVTIGGKLIHYTATAGTVLLKNEKEDSVALLGFTAYIKDGETDPGNRPITFAYNGGPGSSSMWLHMGALGPRVVVTNDAGLTAPAPYKTVENTNSVLDVTDLVMIDPVGTGLSHPIGKATVKDFWGVDQDIKSVSQFINQYITGNDRWNSPKYLLGESYGTMRSAGVSDYLFESMGIQVNGVILVSSVLDFHTLTFKDDLSYELYLPTYAAVAWYHKKIPNTPDGLESFLKEVRTFASGEYAAALSKGDALSDTEKDQVLVKLSNYTGVSKDYWSKGNLRLREEVFTEELLRNEHMTVGRLDARYKGINQDLLSENSKDDPQSTQISSAYIASFMNYFYTELKVNKNLNYKINAYNTEGFKWDFSRKKNGDNGGLYLPNTGEDLASLMSKNPNVKILVLNGYYDLATPFYATEYTFDHLALEKKIKNNISMKYFEAGHMMYVNPASLILFKKTVADFIQGTTR
jgi:carboxypeptidase C (cathepsin A)